MMACLSRSDIVMIVLAVIGVATMFAIKNIGNHP